MVLPNLYILKSPTKLRHHIAPHRLQILGHRIERSAAQVERRPDDSPRGTHTCSREPPWGPLYSGTLILLGGTHIRQSGPQPTQSSGTHICWIARRTIQVERKLEDRPSGTHTCSGGIQVGPTIKQDPHIVKWELHIVSWDPHYI